MVRKVFLFCLWSGSLFAGTVQLDFSVLPQGFGRYHYDFALTLTNDSGLWSPGYGFNGIIFGKYLPGDYGKPLTDFVIDAVPPPFQYGLASSGGASNMPTLIESGKGSDGGWLPSQVGDSLRWSGTASVSLVQGELYAVYMYGWGREELLVASQVPASVPEPATMGYLAFALAGLAFARRSLSSKRVD